LDTIKSDCASIILSTQDEEIIFYQEHGNASSSNIFQELSDSSQGKGECTMDNIDIFHEVRDVDSILDTNVHNPISNHSDKETSEIGLIKVNTTLDVRKGSEDNHLHHEDTTKFIYNHPIEETYQGFNTRGSGKGNHQEQVNHILKVKDNTNYFKRSKFIKDNVHCKQFHCMNNIQEKYIINNWSRSASIDIKEILSHSPPARDNFLSPYQEISIKEPMDWNEPSKSMKE
jgi:hypothetical protein